MPNLYGHAYTPYPRTCLCYKTQCQMHIAQIYTNQHLYIVQTTRTVSLDSLPVSTAATLIQLYSCLMQWSQMHAYQLDQCYDGGATYQLMQPRHLVFGNCYSLSTYYFRFCGSCPNQCCYPVSGSTASVPVICNNSYRTSVKMFIIEKCKCDYECPA